MSQMKPILFNTEMVRAILDGRKTVTRRVVPERLLDKYYDYDDWCNAVMPRDIPCTRNYESDFFMARAPYQPGEILYVRETWCIHDLNSPAFCMMTKYKADGYTELQVRFKPSRFNKFKKFFGKHGWISALFMPKEAARIFLRVTNVHVERLQDIDGLSAFDEGAVAEMPGACLTPRQPEQYEKWSKDKQDEWLRSMATSSYIAKLEFANSLIKAFEKIWDSTVPKKDLDSLGWAANPWVWVYEFERCEKPEE